MRVLAARGARIQATAFGRYVRGPPTPGRGEGRDGAVVVVLVRERRRGGGLRRQRGRRKSSSQGKTIRPF